MVWLDGIEMCVFEWLLVILLIVMMMCCDVYGYWLVVDGLVLV